MATFFCQEYRGPFAWSRGVIPVSNQGLSIVKSSFERERGEDKLYTEKVERLFSPETYWKSKKTKNYMVLTLDDSHVCLTC